MCSEWTLRIGDDGGPVSELDRELQGQFVLVINLEPNTRVSEYQDHRISTGLPSEVVVEVVILTPRQIEERLIGSLDPVIDLIHCIPVIIFELVGPHRFEHRVQFGMRSFIEYAILVSTVAEECGRVPIEMLELEGDGFSSCFEGAVEEVFYDFEWVGDGLLVDFEPFDGV